MTDQSKATVAAILAVADAIEDAVRAAGSQGAPAGTIYAALMHVGFTLGQFELFMGMMVKAGRIFKKGHLYFISNQKGI